MSFEEECLIVAAAYPVSPDVLDEVETLSGMKVRAVLAPEKELKQALKKAYGSAPEHVYGENPYVSMERPGVGVGAAAEASVSELAFMERVESAPVVRMRPSIKMPVTFMWSRERMIWSSASESTGT